MIDLTFVIANGPRGTIGTLRADRARAAGAIDKALAKTPAARFRDGAETATASRYAAAASV